MNILKSVTLLSCVGMLGLSAASHAGSPAAAMDACVKAFTDSQLTGHKVVSVRRESAAPSQLLPHASQNVHIALDARTGNTVVASATCVATREGVVLSMNSAPGVDSAVASR